MMHGDISDSVQSVVMFDLSMLYDTVSEATLFGPELKSVLSPVKLEFLRDINSKATVVLLKLPEERFKDEDKVPAIIRVIDSLVEFKATLLLYVPQICVTKFTKKYGVNKYARKTVDTPEEAWRILAKECGK